MRNLIIFFTLLLHTLSASGQLQPMFQTTVYFEDAVGNKDSIIVGYDTLANTFFNPQFGEVNIDTPFDSVFEVRAAHGNSFGWGEGDYTLTKKITGFAENYFNFPSCYIGENPLFFIHAKFQPVTIRWDRDIFDNNCLHGSFLTPDRLFQMIDPWAWFGMPGIRYGCSSTDSVFTLSLGNTYRAPMEIPYIAMQEVTGNGGVLDSIFGVTLWFNANLGFSPCSLVPTQEVLSTTFINTATVFPNPAGQQVVLSNQDGLAIPSLFIYDQLGKLVLDDHLKQLQASQSIDVSSLSPGLYFLVQRWASGQLRVNKLVKL